MLNRLKDVARQRPWVPDHGGLLLRQARRRNARGGYSDFDHLRAAAHWLCAAQDCQTDGGFCGRYRLDRGWTSSYPETTGYLIPTLLALDKLLPGTGYAARAARAVDFLTRIQLDCGGFPGMEIADNTKEPSPFNTAQILSGLTAWHKTTGDSRAFAAAEGAAQWLMRVQDGDGAFRKHTYLDLETTYTAHLSSWLAEWGTHAGDEASLAAAGRHLDWVLGQVGPDGWIAKMGFGKEQLAADEAFTHTIAYTLAGILTTSLLTGREDGIAAATRGAEALLRLMELKGTLPGVISHWQARSDSICLTGNAQTALIWFKLHRHAPNLRFVNGALKAIDAVKAAQPMTGQNPGITGGIAGSDPVGGPYIPNALPNWAAKFFIDALLEKQAVLHDLTRAQHRDAVELESFEPTHAARRAGANVHIVILTRADFSGLPALLDAIGKGGRVTVVSERARRGQRFDGLARLARPASPVGAACRERGVALVETGPFERPDAIAAVKALAPDLGIAAGAPILRKGLLDCFRLGVVNAHDAMLPVCRGPDAAEWAVLEGVGAGCSVHLIDEGIGTGPLLARRAFDICQCRDRRALHAAVDRARLELLAEVVAGIIESGALPEIQHPPEPPGPQHFRLHGELAAVADRMLEAQALT